MLKLDDLRGLSGKVAIDFETTGVNPYKDEPLGLGVWAPELGVAGYLPCSREDIPAIREVMLTWEPGTWVFAHNLKFELHLLQLCYEQLKHFRWFDTQLAEHLLNEEYAHDLGSTETRRLGTRTKKHYLEDSKQWGGIRAVDEWPVEEVARYCVNDCRITYDIAQVQSPQLRLEELTELFTIQMRYLLNLYLIERQGMLVDQERVAELQDRIDEAMDIGEVQLWGALSREGLEMINYGSSKQLSKLLYQDLGLPWPEMPEELAGSPKAAKYNSTRTDQMFLKALDHPIAKLILDLKKTRKIESYLKSYLKLGVPDEDGLGWVVHPSFNPTGTVTGRLSCSEPNLQQVSDKPVAANLTHDGHGLRLRSVFAARPGYRMVSIDYKQMEVVAFALFSQEPKLIEMVRTGEDMHRQVAELMFGHYDESRRKVVKTLNFGLLYGLGVAGMAEQIGVTPKEAQKLMAKYMGTFNVRPWMADVAATLEKLKYVRYWSGRKRRITDRRYHYRGVNAVVQGGCADILAVATNRVSAWLRRTGYGHIVALIHDEMLLELKDDHLDEAVAGVRKRMAVEDLFDVPFNTDVEVGTHWANPHPDPDDGSGSAQGEADSDDEDDEGSTDPDEVVGPR